MQHDVLGERIRLLAHQLDSAQPNPPADSNPPASDDDNSMPALPNTSRAVFLDTTRTSLNESVNDEHTKLWGYYIFRTVHSV